jgi:hypothetical protein
VCTRQLKKRRNGTVAATGARVRAAVPQVLTVRHEDGGQISHGNGATTEPMVMRVVDSRAIPFQSADDAVKRGRRNPAGRLG